MGYIVAPLRGGKSGAGWRSGNRSAFILRGNTLSRTPTYEITTLIVAAQTSLPLVAMYIKLDAPRRLFLRAIAAPGQTLL